MAKRNTIKRGNRARFNQTVMAVAASPKLAGIAALAIAICGVKA